MASEEVSKFGVRRSGLRLRAENWGWRSRGRVGFLGRGSKSPPHQLGESSRNSPSGIRSIALDASTFFWQEKVLSMHVAVVNFVTFTVWICILKIMTDLGVSATPTALTGFTHPGMYPKNWWVFWVHPTKKTTPKNPHFYFNLILVYTLYATNNAIFYCFRAFQALSYWVFVLFYLVFPACPKNALSWAF